MVVSGYVIQPTRDGNGNTTVNILGGSGNSVASGYGGQTIAGGGNGYLGGNATNLHWL